MSNSSRQSSPKLRARDGCRHSHVEALGSVGSEAWYEQLVGYLLPDGLGYAVALVAHDDDAVWRQLLLVDVVSVEQGAVNGV